MIAWVLAFHFLYLIGCSTSTPASPRPAPDVKPEPVEEPLLDVQQVLDVSGFVLRSIKRDEPWRPARSPGSPSACWPWCRCCRARITPRPSSWHSATSSCQRWGTLAVRCHGLRRSDATGRGVRPQAREPGGHRQADESHGPVGRLRALVLRAKDLVLRPLSGPPKPEDKLEALIGLLGKRFA